MGDWNTIVTVHDEGYVRSRRVLARLGRVDETDQYNVLVMSVEAIPAFLAAAQRLFDEDPSLADDIARILPLMRCFEFATGAELERDVVEIAKEFVGRLAGRSFHVRLHCRDAPEPVSARELERTLDRVLLDALDEAGTPGSIAFDDPDVVIDVETLGGRGGMSMWTRDDLVRYAFLRVD